jgi:hypothetical protein
MHEIGPLHLGVMPNNQGLGMPFPVFCFVPFVCSLANALNAIKTVKSTALA